MKKTSLLLIILLCSCSGNQPSKQIRNLELTSGIFILDNDKPIYTLSELTDHFKNKPLFIDRWATWCSPCIEEFKHSDSLHKFLKENNIEMIYLNSDQEISDSTYRQFIISHNLTGYHLRMTDSLKKDLIQQKIFIPIIPKYLIVNKEGKVIENNALRPSDGIKLLDQIKSKLSL